MLLGVVAILICLTFRDYGVTWDEEHSALNGRYFLDWYASGFRDRSIVTENNQLLYGSFFNGISAFIADHSPFGKYETGHLVIAATGLAGIFFAYRMGKLLAGSMGGFLSALVLTLTPAYYGHSFMNPKDLPFAVLFLISVYCLLRVYDQLPAIPARSAVVLGIVTGLTLGIRIGGVMVFGCFVAAIGFRVLARYRKDSPYGAREVLADVRDSGASLIRVGVLAWIVMLVWWPFAQLNPLIHPLIAARENANFEWRFASLYRGSAVLHESMPWHYLPNWFLITLPETYYLALAVAFATLVIRFSRFRRADEKADADHQSKLMIVAFAAFSPVAMALLTRPVLYDANRHFLFITPLLAVLAGAALATFFSTPVSRMLRVAIGALVVIVCTLTAADMVRLHPYQYVFFNRSFGGLEAALGRYETDYWGASYKEGMDWLISNYSRDAARASIRVANTSSPFQTSYYIAGDRPETRRFASVDPMDRPNVVLSTTRFNFHLKFPGKVVHVVRRGGTPLLYVIEVKEPPSVQATHKASA